MHLKQSFYFLCLNNPALPVFIKLAFHLPGKMHRSKRVGSTLLLKLGQPGNFV